MHNSSKVFLLATQLWQALLLKDGNAKHRQPISDGQSKHVCHHGDLTATILPQLAESKSKNTMYEMPRSDDARMTLYYVRDLVSPV